MKLPIGFTVPDESPGVEVARKTIAQVSSTVRWTWAVVCRALGRGNDSSVSWDCGASAGAWTSAIVGSQIRRFLLAPLHSLWIVNRSALEKKVLADDYVLIHLTAGREERDWM